MNEMINDAESLAIADIDGSLPLHRLLTNKSSSMDAALMMIEQYSSALQHQNKYGRLPLHLECRYQCRSAIIIRCVDLYPESLTSADNFGYLPLHRLLENEYSSIDDALMMIEKYPLQLQHKNGDVFLPLHLECRYQCRSAMIIRCMDLYPESLAVADMDEYLPLHQLLSNKSSYKDAALMMIEQYSSALQHQNKYGRLPLHLECSHHCRSSIIIRCVDLYPESLTSADNFGYLPLHRLLENEYSSIDDALMMIEKYPLQLQHKNSYGEVPIHIECQYQCRSTIISKCVQVYPLAVDEKVVTTVVKRITQENFHHYQSALSIVFTARPDYLYGDNDDIRANRYYRRRILNLLPRHVFTPTHEADYRDLNWQPRYAMMMLLVQLQIHVNQQQQESRRLDEMDCRMDTAWCVLLLQMAKISSIVDANTIQRRVRICQDNDLGDAFLRLIIAFL
jgi:hypothetical protein